MALLDRIVRLKLLSFTGFEQYRVGSGVSTRPRPTSKIAAITKPYLALQCRSGGVWDLNDGEVIAFVDNCMT